MPTTARAKIDLSHSEVILRFDGIIQVNATDHSYSKADILELHHAFATLSENKKSLILLVANEFTTIETDARQFLGTPEAGKYSIAEAYVIHSLAQRMLLNFLFSVQGTPVPAKFFTDIDRAVEWLKRDRTIN